MTGLVKERLPGCMGEVSEQGVDRIDEVGDRASEGQAAGYLSWRLLIYENMTLLVALQLAASVGFHQHILPIACIYFCSVM